MIKILLNNERRKLGGGTILFLVLLVITTCYALEAKPSAYVAVLLCGIMTLFTAFLARGFSYEQRHNQLPFMLAMPTRPRTVFLTGYLAGIILLFLVGIPVAFALSRGGHYFTVYRYLQVDIRFFLPLIFPALYAFLLMNSQWNEQGAAEVILLLFIFGIIVVWNRLSVFFYYAVPGIFAYTLTGLQLVLVVRS